MPAETKLGNGAPVGATEQVLHYKYLKEFRVEQCPLFLQHKCQQHRPFTCFNWHFQNQKRRRPVRRRDHTFNYSADIYCEKYDETTGLCPNGDECPLLHRTAGDTERRYHLRYYKTGMCVHDTDNRGYCVKNGPHCAFAHGANDLRPPVYDSREQKEMLEPGEDNKMGPNSLDKERSLLNDDPKWLDTTYVLANYKTEPCKKPPRLCRQGYACPQFHNNKDRRRSPKKYKYRSTPCPAVKTADEWGDPVNCDSGDNCQYCHTRTEQQFHPEIYKSTKCNDIQNTSYCPRGAFCAFAHLEQESLDNGPEGGPNFAEILNKALPDSDHSSCDSQSDRSSNSGEMGEYSWGENSRAPGSHLNPIKAAQPTTPPNILDSINSGHSSIPASPTYHKMRTSSGDSCRLRNKLMQIGGALDDLSITDLYEGSKSRKSSGFSETTKSRNCSGMDGDKSRNCSGNSISQGLVSSGFLSSSTNPVNIPGSGESLLDRNDGFGLLSTMTSALSESTYMTGLGTSNLGFSTGLFDFGPSNQSCHNVKDVEICRLREELGAARAKLHSWEESMGQARTACDAWKKEAALANKKAELANKEKEVAIAKANSLQKEMEQLSGGPLLHALRRVADLPNLPPAVLKTLEWTLRKDIQEIEKAMRSQSDQHLWMSNNRLLENVGVLPNTQANINDWALGLNLQPIYSQMSQQ
eukprot:GFUD01013629.1.p1 GENE.GFUD01013629.1~~GFUD01013629.1.p1  ORF type:complete len:694 (-),score=86.14 GFUD01013629.1:1015-3096(-)